MPDAVAVVAEEEVIVDAAVAETATDDDADFESGFTNTPTESTPPAEGEEGDKPAEKEVVAEPAAEIKFRQVTEAEWQDLTAKAASIEQIKAEHAKRLDTAFGKVGGIERTLAQLQAATPSGYAIDVTDDIVADLKQEFPELGDLVLKSLKGLASKMKGTAPAAAAVDPEQIRKAVRDSVAAEQAELLEEDRANWREIVGAADSNTDYRKWLATQSAEYQQRLASTNSASVISKSITKFESDAAAAKAAALASAEAEKLAAGKNASTRQRRLEAAATPKGIAGHSSAGTEDDFEAGFKSG